VPAFGLPSRIWNPIQLRHARLTEIRKKLAWRQAGCAAGTAEIGITQHYAEQDRALALQVMKEDG